MSTINSTSVVNTQEKKSNSFRNGLIGTATGAVIGGGVGYLTTNLAKDGIPTDKFVHTVTKEHFIDQAKTNSVLKEAGLDIKLDKIKELLKKDNLTTEELKSFLEKHKKYFKKELERFNNGGADKELSTFKKLIEKYNKNFNIVKEQLTNSFDATKKKFNYANIKNSNLSILAEASEKTLKIGNTVKYGAIAAVSLGLITALATKLKERDN